MILANLLLLLAMPILHSKPPDPQAFALVGGTVIDGTGAAPIPDAVVIFESKRIRAVGPRATTPIPPMAHIIDVHGKWILPGLIDMHVHLDEDLSPWAFPLFGVTSVRDVGSRLVSIQKLRALATKGDPIPRIFWMGRNIDEGKPSWWGAVAVKGPEEVPALLDDMARQGADGFKLYTAAGPSVVRAVIRGAHDRGWPVTGHLERTHPSHAAQMGIDNLEHVSTLLQELRGPEPTSATGYLRGFERIPAVDLSGKHAQALIAILKGRTAITPTLTVSTMPVEGARGAAKAYLGWADVPEGWARYWKSSYWSFISTAGWKQSDFATALAAYAKSKELVRLLEQAGIPIIAGTDTPAPWVLPGAGLIHELELLVDAGLTPMSAIQAATGRAGVVLRRAKDVGTIQIGRFADLLILDADPLADIHNLRKIHFVYKNGWEFDLPSLRKRFERANEPPIAKPP